jgi:hypothetical protein
VQLSSLTESSKSLKIQSGVKGFIKSISYLIQLEAKHGPGFDYREFPG